MWITAWPNLPCGKQCYHIFFCRIGYIYIWTKMSLPQPFPQAKPSFAVLNVSNIKHKSYDICERCVIFKCESRDRLLCWHWSLCWNPVVHWMGATCSHSASRQSRQACRPEWKEPFIFHPTKWNYLGQENDFYSETIFSFSWQFFLRQLTKRWKQRFLLHHKGTFPLW